MTFVFALLGAVSIAAGQDLPWPGEHTAISDIGGSTAGADMNGTAAYACIVHAGCVTSIMPARQVAKAYVQSRTFEAAPVDAPGTGRATPPQLRPPIAVTTS